MSKYPPLIDVLKREAFACFYQTAVVGIALTFFFYPIYMTYMPLLQAFVAKYAPVGFNRDAITFSILINGLHTFVYIVWNSGFAIFDHFKLFQNYKLDRKSYMEPKSELIVSTLLLAARQQLINNVIGIYLLYPYFKYFGMFDFYAKLPPLSHMFLCFCFTHEVNYFLFYVFHRLIHHKSLYTLFHKQHHEYSGPISISSEYAGFVETILANIVPTLVGSFLVGTHPLCVAMTMGMRLQQTYEAHSGYSFEGTFLDTIGLCHGNQTVHHDYHHTVNTGNFGTEFYDYIFGTMGESYLNEGCKDGYTMNHRGVTHSTYPSQVEETKEEKKEVKKVK